MGPKSTEGPHDFGNYIAIQYDNGLVATYMHLEQGSTHEIMGALVHPGDVIGDVGLTGATTGPHLHVTYGQFSMSFANDSTGKFADGALHDNAGPPVGTVGILDPLLF